MAALSVLFRALYPIMWSLGPHGSFSWKVELSTQPYYLCVTGMLGTVLIWAVPGVNLAHDVHPAAAAACIVGFWLAFMAAMAVSRVRLAVRPCHGARV
jgi:hypothetical protein